MRLARSDVLAEEVSVDVNGYVYVLHDGVGCPVETASPHFVAHGPLAYETTSCTKGPRPMTLAAPPSRLRRRLLLAVAAVAVAGSVVAAVYGIDAFSRNVPDGPCGAAVQLARRVSPLARGEVAAFAAAEKGLGLPDLAFRDASGGERHLSQWRGRTVLLNLWATWCVPCRKEMPALNALEKELGGPSFVVVAVNIDTRDPDKPRAWLKEAGIHRLAYYADPSARGFQDLKT